MGTRKIAPWKIVSRNITPFTLALTLTQGGFDGGAI